MSKKFTPETVPGGPQIEAPGTLWSYGNSVPELD